MPTSAGSSLPRMAPAVTATPLQPLPSAILFDLDDTLCDYSAARDARLRVAFSLDAMGRPVERSADELAAMIAESIRIHPHGVDHFGDLFRRYGAPDSRIAETAARWYRSNRFHGLQLFPEAIAALQAVRTAGSPPLGRPRPVGIITNGPAEVQRAKLDLLGLHDLVDFVIISEELGVAKPDAAIFDEALDRAGVDASEAVFIGDSAEFDMAGALARGIPTIWVNRQRLPWERGVPRPDREVLSIGEVPALVGSS
jgi:HAD superfamily hydrolase (TIGR01509 family)